MKVKRNTCAFSSSSPRFCEGGAEGARLGSDLESKLEWDALRTNSPPVGDRDLLHARGNRILSLQAFPLRGLEFSKVNRIFFFHYHNL